MMGVNEAQQQNRRSSLTASEWSDGLNT